jgi:hypothetical protein
VFEDADFIFTYSRAQAIADGVLVDVSETAREAGFRIPVAMTTTAWAEGVEWTERDAEASNVPQDEVGRLWDVLTMARHAAQLHKHRDTNRCAFALYRVARGEHRTTRCELALHVGPGDAGEPVITIMLPHED